MTSIPCVDVLIVVIKPVSHLPSPSKASFKPSTTNLDAVAARQTIFSTLLQIPAGPLIREAAWSVLPHDVHHHVPQKACAGQHSNSDMSHGAQVCNNHTITLISCPEEALFSEQPYKEITDTKLSRWFR